MHHPIMTDAELASLPALITPRQFADLAGVHPHIAQNMCKHGELPAVKFGGKYRINKAKALALLGLDAEGASAHDAD